MSYCAIVIPLYKAEPTRLELASFEQCLKVLGHYTIFIVSYHNLDMSCYEQIANKYGKALKMVYFNYKFFSSIRGYNKLLLTSQFYESFSDYDYILIYQLDAWVFRDELQIWCDKGYDYIGAPLFEIVLNEEGETILSKTMTSVGNGGFSLRRVAYCLKLLNKFKYQPLLKPNHIWTNSLHKYSRFKIFRLILVVGETLLKSCGWRNNISYYSSSGRLNEDVYFSEYANLIWGGREIICQLVKKLCILRLMQIRLIYMD